MVASARTDTTVVKRPMEVREGAATSHLPPLALTLQYNAAIEDTDLESRNLPPPINDVRFGP